MAKIDTLEIGRKIKRPKSSAVAVVADLEIFVPLQGIIDVEKEAKRLAQKIKDLESFLRKTEKKLKNKQFLSRAPKEVVLQERAKKEQLKNSIKKLKDNLKGFK